MNRRSLGLVVILMTAMGLVWSQASGHTIFKKQIQKKYEHLVVKCEACHVKKEPKTVRNAFGELFYQEMKDENFTEQWEKLKGLDRKKFETEVMAPKFDEILEEIKERTNKEGDKYGDLLTAAKLENTRIRSDDDDDDDDEDDDDDGRYSSN
ncbi:MAG TPA: hypothetical protein PKD54_08930 [Pirellulaceae bacterium]|nr:hypothetical protein [Pirellulaceae bacterium]